MSVTAIPQTDPATEEDAAPGGRRRKALLLLVVVLIAAGATGWTLLRGGEPSAPEPGAVVTLDPVQVNLAGEHYLRIGIALQMTTEAEAEVDGSKALDAMISRFSGQPVGKVNDPRTREELRDALLEDLEHRYEDQVMGVYFTEFVTQ